MHTQGCRIYEIGVPTPLVSLSKTNGFRLRGFPFAQSHFLMVFDSLFCPFRENDLKLFINASVYKGFRLLFFDAAKPSFPYGKVRSRKVAKAHQGRVKNLMLFDMFFALSRKGHSKVTINDSVYKVFATAFFHFLECSFRYGKVNFGDVAKCYQN